MIVASQQCSICRKQLGTSYCTGCGAYFCMKHFRQHRQTLTGQLETILADRSALQERIQQAKQAKDVRSPLLAQIDEWQSTTIARVKAVAEQARAQVAELLESRRTKLSNDFKRFSHELLDFKETENFVEHDLTRSKRLLQQLSNELKQWHQPVTIEIHTEQSNRIPWHRLIYAEDKSTYAGIQDRQQQLTGFLSKAVPFLFCSIDYLHLDEQQTLTMNMLKQPPRMCSSTIQSCLQFRHRTSVSSITRRTNTVLVTSLPFLGDPQPFRRPTATDLEWLKYQNVTVEDGRARNVIVVHLLRHTGLSIENHRITASSADKWTELWQMSFAIFIYHSSYWRRHQKIPPRAHQRDSRTDRWYWSFIWDVVSFRATSSQWHIW